MVSKRISDFRLTDGSLTSAGRGRESGGDAWKEYVRWSACTSKRYVSHRVLANNLNLSFNAVNFSDAAPLAQGVSFAA